jgi:tetratricopeptide (TPR) repeat protein
MVDSSVLTLLVDLALRLRDALAKHRKEVVPVAIDQTAAIYSEIGTLREALAKWTEGKGFEQLLERLKDGDRNLTDEDIVTSFIQTTDFYYGADTRVVASKILTVFVCQLTDQLYRSESGLGAVARREERLHAKTQEMVGGLKEQNTAAIAELTAKLDKVISILPADDISGSPRVSEQIMHARIDQARTLLQQGRPVAARTLLQDIRKEADTKVVSKDIYFRIATNLGACALQLDEIAVARKEFAAAAQHAPENPKALANLGVIALIDGKYEDALRLSTEARQKQERFDSQSTGVFMQALARLGKWDELEKLAADSQVKDDPFCCLVLGQIMSEKEQYDAAESWLRNSLKKDPSNAQTSVLLALVLLGSVKDAFEDNPPLPWRLDKSWIDRLNEALNHLTQAVQLFKDQDYRRNLHMALTNRGVVLSLLGKFPEANQDYDWVLSESPSNDVALRNKAMILLQQDKPREAIALFEKIQTPDELEEFFIPLAHAYIQVERFDDAVNLLKNHRDPTSGDRRQILVADLLSLALYKMGKVPEAESLLSEFGKKWSDDSDVLSVMAGFKRRQGEIQTAIGLLQQALANATGPQKDRITLELADTLYLSKNDAQAAGLYKKIVDTSQDNPLFRKYLTALYHAGAYREALALAQQLRHGGPPIPLVSEIEAAVLEYIGDLQEARNLWEGLAGLEPENSSHRIRVLLLDLRRGDLTRARDQLSRISYEQIKNDARALINVAWARLTLGEGDFMPLAYRARRIAFGDPDVHLAYTWFFLSRSDVKPLKPSKIEVDCAVHLQRNGEKRNLVLLNEGPFDLARGEISMQDPTAAKILGKGEGDEIALKAGPIEELTFIVQEIQSKYVYAFQETLLNFGSWFPDHPGLHRVKIEENNFAKVFALLDERYMHARKLVDFYKSQNMPLGLIAKFTGNTAVETWASMIGWKHGRIIAFTGSPEDADQEIKLITTPDEIVVDISALLTLQYLDLNDMLTAKFKKIFAPQSVLDEITTTINRNYIGVKTSGALWKDEGAYFKHEANTETLEAGKLFLENLRSFLKAHATVVPVAEALEVGKQRYDNLKGLIGESSIAACLVARGRNLPLYADDQGLSSLAKTEWGVQSAWTQSMLRMFFQSGLIDRERYFDAIRKLALANYTFVSIDSDFVMWVLRRNRMSITPEVEKVLQLLVGPDCNEDSAVLLLSEVTRQIWLDGVLFQQRFLILDAELQALATGRPTRQVLQKFRQALRVRFHLLPLDLEAILQSIDIWEKQRLRRLG